MNMVRCKKIIKIIWFCYVNFLGITVLGLASMYFISTPLPEFFATAVFFLMMNVSPKMALMNTFETRARNVDGKRNNVISLPELLGGAALHKRLQSASLKIMVLESYTPNVPRV
jgi:hypothetical protein